MDAPGKKFFWGVALSAHQAEGGTANDWTAWERSHAGPSAARARKKSWPAFLLDRRPHPCEEGNYISGNAADHYRRFQEDIGRAAALGVNAFRFSIEWSRIEPEEEKFDEKEIEHYRKVIQMLRERGIEPFVTLWHWTLPQWFAKKGGWIAADAVRNFVRFASRMGKEFQEVRYWILVNEPGLWAADAYLFGVKPPGRRNIALLIRTYWRLVEAERASYAAMKRVRSDFSLGVSESMEYCGHASFRRLFDYFRNFFFLRRILPTTDFIGINYYKRVGFFAGTGVTRSDMGWGVYPEGLGYFLRRVSRWGKPIVVTENGIADARDAMRPEFLQKHIEEVLRAQKDGVDVRGYFYWSLLDTFEWEHGFWPRFGLYEVSYKTMERRMRKSGEVYAAIIRNFTS